MKLILNQVGDFSEMLNELEEKDLGLSAGVVTSASVEPDAELGKYVATLTLDFSDMDGVLYEMFVEAVIWRGLII